MAATNPTQKPSRAVVVQEIKGELAKHSDEMLKTLPAHINRDRFNRIAFTAIAQNPDLADCTRASLFRAIQHAATDGLVLDGREAALAVFNNKGVKTATYMPMFQGIIKKARNSGELAAIYAHVVYEQDEFDYLLGDTPRIHHKPALSDRGNPIGAYAIAKLKGDEHNEGETVLEFMNVGEIERIRSVSRAREGNFWKNWWDEMAKKTVVRRLSKYLPQSSDVNALFRQEEEDDEWSGPEIDGATGEVTEPEKKPEPAKPSRTKAAMQAKPELPVVDADYTEGPAGDEPPPHDEGRDEPAEELEDIV
jgi:recombination protein RecT